MQVHARAQGRVQGRQPRLHPAPTPTCSRFPPISQRCLCVFQCAPSSPVLYNIASCLSLAERSSPQRRACAAVTEVKGETLPLCSLAGAMLGRCMVPLASVRCPLLPQHTPAAHQLLEMSYAVGHHCTTCPRMDLPSAHECQDYYRPCLHHSACCIGRCLLPSYCCLSCMVCHVK